MQIYQGFESKLKIALKMGKTNLSAFTEGKGWILFCHITEKTITKLFESI